MPIFGKSKDLKEIEREVKFKQGLARVRTYIDRSHHTRGRLWKLGKRSLSLGDHRQFEQIVRAYLRTGDIINKWELYLVAAETIAVQRGQVKATQEFMGSLNALSESMMAGTRPEDVVEMQVELKKALAKAQTIDETLSAVMDAASDTIFSTEGLREEDLKNVEGTMLAEAAREEEGTARDDRIAEGIIKIEEEMRKEMK